jgi:hypothetical protein
MPKKSRRGRKQGIRETSPDKILIVCEGKKTEPNYFKYYQVKYYGKFQSFGSINKDSFVIKGDANNTKQVVEEGIKQNNRIGPFDKVFSIFDKDDFPTDHFNGAIGKAFSNNIVPIWTNEAFELWYLLHFCYVNSAISRDQYISKLSEKLNTKYEKNNADIRSQIKDNGGTLERAIKNSVKLNELYSNQKYHLHNPCTQVHELVLYLEGLVK